MEHTPIPLIPKLFHRVGSFGPLFFVKVVKWCWGVFESQCYHKANRVMLSGREGVPILWLPDVITWVCLPSVLFLF